MDFFNYKNGELHCEEIPVERIAREVGTPAYVYSKTHVKTTTGKKETKFGVDIERAERVFEQYRGLKNLRIGGVHIHIGSPVYEIQPYIDAVKKVTALIDRLTERGHKIEWFDA